MKMNSNLMRKKLQERLERPGRSFSYDREKQELRIENKNTGKGITVSIPGAVAKWEEQKEKAIDRIVYYIEEGLEAMDKELNLSGREKNIYPVIRSASFPTTANDGTPLLYDDHTAETRIYYAVDSEKSYRLIDKKLMEKEGWNHERIKEIARFNVRSLSTDLKEDEVAGNKFYFLNKNDGYDASRILNDVFLREMKEKISGTMVLAVPHQDVLIIADIQNETGYDVLAQLTMNFFTNGRVPITALSFLYEEGELEPIFILAKNQKK